MSSPAGDPFQIDANTGTITTTAGFAGVAGDSYSLTVEAYDEAHSTGIMGHQVTKSVHITVGRYGLPRTDLPPALVRNTISFDFDPRTNATPGVTVDVLANDGDEQPVGLRIVSVTQPRKGEVVIIPGRSGSRDTLRYLPDPTFAGYETLQYVVADSDGLQSSENLVIAVNAASLVPRYQLSMNLAEPPVFVPIPGTTQGNTSAGYWDSGRVVGVVKPLFVRELTILRRERVAFGKIDHRLQLRF